MIKKRKSSEGPFKEPPPEVVQINGAPHFRGWYSEVTAETARAVAATWRKWKGERVYAVRFTPDGGWYLYFPLPEDESLARRRKEDAIDLVFRVELMGPFVELAKRLAQQAQAQQAQSG